MGPERKIELSYMFFYFDTTDASKPDILLTQGQLSNLTETHFTSLKDKFA